MATHLSHRQSSTGVAPKPPPGGTYAELAPFCHDPMPQGVQQCIPEGIPHHMPQLVHGSFSESSPDSQLGQEVCSLGAYGFNAAAFLPGTQAPSSNHFQPLSSLPPNPHHRHSAPAYYPPYPAWPTSAHHGAGSTAQWVTSQQNMQYDPYMSVVSPVSSHDTYDPWSQQIMSPIPFHQQQQQQQDFPQQQQLPYAFQQSVDQQHFDFTFSPRTSAAQTPTGFVPQMQQSPAQLEAPCASPREQQIFKRESPVAEQEHVDRQPAKRQKQKSKHLTDDEKRALSLQRNREAASKCREKKKCRDEVTHVKYKIYEAKNIEIRSRREELVQEMSALRVNLVNLAAAGSNHPDVRDWISNQSKADEMKRMRYLSSDWTDTEKLRALRNKLHKSKVPEPHSRAQSTADTGTASPESLECED